MRPQTKPPRAETAEPGNFIPVLCGLALVLAVVTWTHWPALSAQALSFDDQQYLTENTLVQHPSWASAKRFLSEVLTPSTVRGYYQPLSMISLMLDVAMGGRPDHLQPFHRTSLALHVLNSFLIVLFLYQLFAEPWIALMVGLLFGVHPLTVEPIPWVGERKTLLAAFFALLALITYMQYACANRKSEIGNRKLITWYLLSLGCYLLALLAKPTSTPLPVLMLLLDYWPLKRFSRQAVIEKIPFFVITAVSVFITIGSQGRTAHADLPTGSIWLMIPLILCHNIIFYPYKMLWPANLSSHYSFPDPLALSQPMVLAGVIGTCLLILLLLFSLRWTRAFLVGWLFFFVAIFPTMGVIGFTDVIASDKYAYLPSVGFLIALTWFLNRWWPSKKPPARALIVVVVLMCVVAEAHATRSYLAVWKTSETLGRHMQHLAPRAWPLHDFMGNVFLQDGKNREAADEYRQALQRNPNEADLHYNFGLALARQGQTDEAVAQYREALRLKTNHLKAHNNLGIVLARQGHHDAALAEYRLAVDLNPEFAEAYNNLGQELAQKGQLDEAVKHFNRVLQLKPDQADAYNNLGNVMTVQGRPDEAIAYYHTALRLKPDYVDAHLNLGRILQRQGRTAESIDEYREVLRINPRHQQARQLLQSATSQPAGTPASRN